MAYTKKKNLIANVFDKVQKEFFERDASVLCRSQVYSRYLKPVIYLMILPSVHGMHTRVYANVGPQGTNNKCKPTESSSILTVYTTTIERDPAHEYQEARSAVINRPQ